MRVTDGKRFSMSLGIWSIVFAVVSAIFVLPGASEAQSPFLYVCIFGGLAIGIPGALGIAIVRENLRHEKGNGSRPRKQRNR